MLSVVFNAAVAVLSVSAVGAHCRKNPVKIVLRFFTVLSNLFCAAACLAVAVARLCGTVPNAVLVLKFVGTSAVAVTLLTVLLFLGPFVYDYKTLLSGPDLLLHLICPVLAVASFLLWDRPKASFGVVFLGVLPVLAYGAFYLYHVVVLQGERRWDDFYGFNRNGKWIVSFAAMTAAAFLISLVLWIV